jgi:glycosyltransferase involved in cell wall biosynthesis
LSSLPRVILNDRVLYRPLTGVGHYVAQLLSALRHEQASVAVEPFLAAFLPPPKPRMKAHRGTTNRLAKPSLVQRARSSWWLRRVLQGAYRTAFRARARGYDLYHEPNHIPIRCGVPTLTTIHDLSVLLHPTWHPTDRVRWYEREFAAGVRQTRRFIAASEFTKREMTQHLGLSPDVIDVTYQAPRPAFCRSGADGARRVCQQLALPERFFLFVGTLEPRKNVPGLLAAFAALPRGLREQNPLVLAGGWGWETEQLAASLRVHDIGREVRLVGYLHDDTLAALYSACTALVWPTFYEGFGLPPLEALACGCPVIVSNAASLPEVVGDAGVLLDPRDEPAWTNALRRMAEDADWRQQWQQRGLQRAATFSWQRCARETIACYRRALAAT